MTLFFIYTVYFHNYSVVISLNSDVSESLCGNESTLRSSKVLAAKSCSSKVHGGDDIQSNQRKSEKWPLLILFFHSSQYVRVIYKNDR